MRIFTHMHVDLDAVASVWAAQTFMTGGHTPVEFVPANWDGAEMRENDLALDIHAGGRGIKGDQEESGVVHSCFATIVANYANTSDQRILAHLVKFIDTQDAHGSAVRFLAVNASTEDSKALAAGSLSVTLRAMQAMHPKQDKLVLLKMSEIFSGILKMGRAKVRARKEANRARILPSGFVAITDNAAEEATSGILFSRGVRVVIYIDGKNLGIVRNSYSGEQLRMDCPEIRAVVEAAEGGTNKEEWFAHPSGFLFCWGTRKAPATVKSVVNPFELAKAVETALLAANPT